MSKKLFSLFLCLFLIFVAVFVVSCGGENSGTESNTNTNTNTDISGETPPPEDEVEPTPCRITFVFNNGESNRTFICASGSVIKDFPSDPVREGYTFIRWVANGKTWYPGIATGDITVTAEWNVNYNNIVFDANGGEGEMAIMTLQTDETKTLLANKFYKDGFAFTGWAVAPKGSVRYKDSASFTMGADKLVTLYAIWKPLDYKITYDLANGVQNGANPPKYSVNSVVTPYAPTRDGYTFSGWTFNGESFTSTEGYYEDLHLVANWELIRYNIIYKNVDSSEHSNPKDFNAEDSFDYSDASRVGYNFNGWYSDDKFKNPVTSLAYGSSGNITLYAKFDIIKYNIDYELGADITGNTGNIDTYDVTTSFTLVEPSFEKEGYEFDGWYIKGTDSKITKLNGGEHLTDLTLVPKLRLIQYPIIYANEQGVAVPSGTKTYYTVADSASTIVLPNLSKTGYSFEGWYADAGYTQKITQISIDPTNPKAITVYGKMTLIKYNITYVYGDKVSGYVVSNPNPSTYDVLNAVILAEATAGDYTTLGWYTDPNFANKLEQIQGRTGDITLYARWATGDNSPTIVLPAEKIDSIYTDGGSGKRENYLYNLVDGDKVTSGIYSDGNDWYGDVGETATIVLTEELDVYMINIYVTGNWTHSSVTCYDAAGNVVIGPYSALGESNKSGEDAEQRVVFESTTPIKVKKIVIQITDFKWGDPKTHKISELEVFVANPDYIPDA